MQLLSKNCCYCFPFWPPKKNKICSLILWIKCIQMFTDATIASWLHCFNVLFQGGNNICELPPEEGPCDAYFEQYFYNSTSETCEEFIYGGCEGNENRFASVEECKKNCTDQSECAFSKNFCQGKAISCVWVAFHDAKIKLRDFACFCGAEGQQKCI